MGSFLTFSFKGRVSLRRYISSCDVKMYLRIACLAELSGAKRSSNHRLGNTLTYRLVKGNFISWMLKNYLCSLLKVNKLIWISSACLLKVARSNFPVYIYALFWIIKHIVLFDMLVIKMWKWHQNYIVLFQKLSVRHIHCFRYFIPLISFY